MAEHERRMLVRSDTVQAFLQYMRKKYDTDPWSYAFGGLGCVNLGEKGKTIGAEV